MLKTFAVIGDPIDHSLSPTIHNAAYRNLNLEPAEQTITLSGKYSGANNFLSITDVQEGFLHLEDGTGLLNVAYTSSNATSGKIQFEESTTFSNVVPKLIV